MTVKDGQEEPFRDREGEPFEYRSAPQPRPAQSRTPSTGTDETTIKTVQEAVRDGKARPGRSGRASLSPDIENTTVSPSGGPSFDDCYTVLLHNPDHDPGSSISKRSGNVRRGCYTNDARDRHLLWPGIPTGDIGRSDETDRVSRPRSVASDVARRLTCLDDVGGRAATSWISPLSLGRNFICARRAPCRHSSCQR
jgi:hypothetical protein